MPLVKTFAEACKYKKVSPKEVLPDVSLSPKEHQKALIASAKLFIIIDVLNEGHRFDWNDTSEWKYFIWWWMDRPGFRLDFVLSDFSLTSAGARLAFRTRALAEHAAKHFKPLFKDFYCQ